MAATDPVNASAEMFDGTHKVAALLLAMGKPLADRLLKHFSEPELRRIVETTATMRSVSRDKVELFVADMAKALERGADVRASAEEFESLLSGVVPPDRVASMMSELRGDSRQSVWSQLVDIPEATLRQFLLKEHPQLAAFILARVGSNLAASVLQQTPAALRAELVRRLLAMRPVTDAAQSIAEQALLGELVDKGSKQAGPPVHSRIADIINKMDRQQMEEVLSDLDLRRPKDAKLVKGLLFTFEDILRLLPTDLVKLFDGVPAERTILALNGATPELAELVLSSVSSRSRRMIEQEVQSGNNVPQREVLKARRAIADLALALAEQGKIDLGQQDVP